MAAHSVIQSVSFGMSADQEHKVNSFAEITSYELNTPNGQPVPNGVYDLRLGTTNHQFLCPTCCNGKRLCPGHRGHLDLKVAVLQPIGIAETRRWLRIICLKCGELVVDREKYRLIPPGKRLAEIAKTDTEGKKCPRRGCGAIHPKIVKDDEDHFTFWAESPSSDAKRSGKAGANRAAEKRGEKLYPDYIRAIFDRVSDSAVEEMGRPADSHPRRLVLRRIVVPTNNIRPGVRSFGGGSNSYHDSTNLLQHIVKRNGTLPSQLPQAMLTGGPAGSVDGELDRAVQNMQQLYYDLIMGSSGTSVTQGASGRRGLVIGTHPVHSFLRTLPRKEGRIRANLLGERVFYISRSTISGNMRFRVDEVGIPLEFARTLQVKETVQEYNLDFLMPFFLNGRRAYPGCSHVVKRATGVMHDVAGLREFRLEVGDVLYRDVINGDLAFFNRQPTLERSSIGVHRVIVIQDPSVHTFQFNVLTCVNYNADFDGDQMNLWVARNPGARAEAMIMSPIANWFISTKTSGPVNGQVQDSTVGCNELTRDTVCIDKFHAMALFATTGTEPPRFDLKPADHIYTGRDIVSLLLSATPINYSRAPSSYSDVYAPYIPFSPTETLTVIERGVLVRGVLDKKSVGAGANGGIFHLISREYGSQRALDVIYALQQIALLFLMMRGFTVGTDDLRPSDEALEQIRALVSSVVLEANVITDRLLRGEIVPPIDSTVHAHYERLQMEALKVSDTEIMRWILGSIRTDTNGFFRMIADGSKGSNPNLVHVMAAILQTKLNGERIGEQFAFRRTLPYYPRFAVDPAAYGFVANSYMTGMQSGEFIFQDMNGRFDLINKALSTASTGYFMRKGVMNNQSSIIDNHRHVSKDTKIVEFIYGEDGLDSRELEKVSFRTVVMGNKALDEALRVDVPAGSGTAAEIAAAKADVAEAIAKCAEDRDQYRRTFMRIESANFGQTFTTDMLMPVNIHRIVEGVFIAAKNAGKPAEKISAANLSARIARVWDLCDRIPYVLINEIQERRRSPIPPHKLAAASLLCMLIRAELSPKILARVSDEELTYIIESIRLRYSQSLIDYGTAVGVLSAQSISEPLTQYMLDSHHRSVAGGTNKSGLVRVSEIYGAKEVSEEQSPSMQLPLRAEMLGPAEGAFAVAQDIANSIEYVTLRRFVSSHDKLLEPYSTTSLIYPDYAGDTQWIGEFERSHPLVHPPNDLTNWCLRFVLDKSALVLKAVDLELIVGRLRRIHPDLYVVHTQESTPQVVIRCWLRSTLFKRDGNDESRADDVEEAALDTPVRGISGILRASVERVSRNHIALGGELIDAKTKTLIISEPGPTQKTEIAEKDQLVKEDRYVIITTGTNLYKALLHSAVDTKCAISTSIADTAKLYGIEAARNKVISETRSFMEDNTPNLRMIYIYADEMTRPGHVTSIERGGLSSREHNNVLLRMANGAPIGVVMDAALANARSRVYGIAAPQLLGSTPQIGTIYNSCIVDEQFVRANTKSVDSILDEVGAN
jgi:DNA-directed RNA polymerase II subunit RPB1